MKAIASFVGRSARTAGLVALAGLAAPAARAAGVVGNGTPQSCTEAALNAALSGGGSVTFNCGASPVVIPITSQKVVSVSTTVDGGSADRIILDAGGATRHFTTTQSLPPGSILLTIRNLTLRNGRCPVPDPGQPSPGYGGSIRSGIDSPLTVQDSRFINNVCDVAGLDVGGGAIRQRRGVLLVQRTLFQGNRAGNAGGISISDSPTTVEDSTFTGNTTNAHSTGFSGVGGAFYVDGSRGGQIVVRRSVFTNNTSAYLAGAMQTFFYPVDQGLVLEDCTFSGNNTPEGAGALLHQTGRATITRTSFTGNTTGGEAGAAFFNQGVNSTISDSTFSGNTALRRAGALWLVNSGAVSITNSTFSGNDAIGIPPNGGATGSAGAISVDGSTTLTVSHSTFANNHADWIGGAIAGGTVTLRANVFSNNVADQSGRHCSGQFGDGGFNVQFPAQSPNCTASALVADPQLGPLASNGGPTQTHALGGSSPARDRVTSGCPPPAADQRGTPRPAGTACDSGSFEASGVLSVNDTSVTEGTGGTVNAAFTVTLSEAAATNVTVGFATVNGTAAAPGDYTASSGTVTFPPGTTSRTVNVAVVGDALDEDDETFFLQLSNPVGAVVADGTAAATIQDNDAPPTVSAGDCTAVEGDSGAAGCTFALTLSGPSGKSVSVSFATANGSAAAGSDYSAASGSAAFAPGATSSAAVVSVLGDVVDEADESFSLNLTGPVNATLGDASGTGTIDDDDGPVVRTSGASVTEGNAGSTPATFTVTLSATSPQTVTVGYATSDGTAVAGSDYTTASGTLTFPSGTTSRTVAVSVQGDTVNEPNERFYVNLQSPVDATLSGAAGTGLIVDDDAGAIPLRELTHGSEVRDDLSGGADVFLLTQPAFSSWEVVLDGATGDAGANGPALDRLSGDLSTVVQTSAAVGRGFARSLRWTNATASQRENYVRVSGPQCGPCGPDDVYRIRVYETTYSIPRFNNAGSQATVLLLQNTTSATVTGTAYFWSTHGALVGALPFTLNPRATLVQNTTSLAAGTGGTITIVHTGRMGDLAGKAVALDPSGGFSFDTTMTPRAR